MAKGRAIVFPTERQAEIQSFDLPMLDENEVRVRTEYSGISQGTEIWAYIGKRPELKYPTVPGYQSIGVIEELGAGVTGYSVGQRVMFVSSRLPTHFPESWMGAHVSRATIPIKDGYPLIIPDGVDPIEAALSALPAVSLRGIRMIDIAIGDLVIVTGQGLIGQSGSQLAKLRGAIVISTDLTPKRLHLSKECGSDFVVNPNEANLADLAKSIKPSGVDAVIETTGRSDQFAPLVDLLRWEGSLLLQGYYPNPVTFDFHATHLKKPKLAITCGFGASEVAVILQLLKYGKLKLRSLASHVVSPNKAPEIYQSLSSNDPNVGGVVFDWNQNS